LTSIPYAKGKEIWKVWEILTKLRSHVRVIC
jgi:hypothetical protein